MLTRLLRRAWRAGRSAPGLRAIVQVGDYAWWARAIIASGLVDAEFYAAQRGWSRVGVRRAVVDYVIRGHRRGISLNPLVDELVMGAGLPESSRVPALYAYLVSDRSTVRVHPWWDGRTAPEVRRARDAVPPLETAWASRADGMLELRVGEVTSAVPTAVFRQWSLDAAAGWRHGDSAAPAEPAAGSEAREVGVLRLVQRGDRHYAAKLEVLVELASGGAQAVVVAVDVDAGQWVAMQLLRRLLPGLVIVAAGRRPSYAVAVSRGAAGASGRTLVVLDPRSSLTAGQVLALAAEAARAGGAVAPVQLAADGTIAAAGAAPVPGGRPYALLSGLPLEDLSRFDGRILDVPLLSGRTFAIRTGDLESLGGLDTTLTNELELEELSARWRARDPAVRYRVLTSMPCPNFAPDRVFTGRAPARRLPVIPGDETGVASEILASAGFDLDGWTRRADGAPEPQLRRRHSPGGGQRWAIKICSPAGPAGDVWGDTHFARGLARALERAGHEVVVDAYEARARATSYLDDVTVVVRGPHRIDPPSTGVRLEWIISHPDDITKLEVTKFDAVFAASERWAARASAEFGIEVTPLLECTDTDQFFPRGLDRGDDIVFVGTSRGIARPSVVAPLAAGIPVRVYGPDWRGFIPPEAIAAPSIPNSELSVRYETASVVLNDHWPAMRREGFMAMRPFDVVAAGGRVISENVDGLSEIFGGAVVPYATEEQLVGFLRGDLDSLFPGDDELAVIAERIRRHHSFDSRAEVLRAAVAAVREATSSGKTERRVG